MSISTDWSATHMMEIARTLEMSLANLADVLVLQVVNVFLRACDPSHSFSIFTALAYSSMFCFSIVVE